VLVAGALSASCDAPPDPRLTGFRIEKPGVAAEYDQKTGRLARLEIDSNKDGAADTWTYADGARIERIEIDRDYDGTVDRWEYYAEGNRLEKVGSSTRGDGVVDQWAFADGSGVLQRVETDTDRDGRVDKWEHFAAPASPGAVPALVAVEFDRTGAGRPTQRLEYRPDGTATMMSLEARRP
jgi:hypothetical protein